jgi:hypothetical protein
MNSIELTNPTDISENQDSTTLPTSNTPPEQTPATPASEFKIPDEYKEKGWTKALKSESDLWKTLDNAQGLIGKKMVVPNLNEATPEQVEEYYSQLRPKEKSEYKFGEEVAQEVKDSFADIFYKHGISAKQGNDLVQDYLQFERQNLAKAYDADDFVKELKSSFGDGYEKDFSESSALLRNVMSKEDAELLEKTPNRYLGIIHRLANKINKAYGIQEGGAPANNSSVGKVVNSQEERMSIIKELGKLQSRPHSLQEKQDLLHKLNSIKG